MTFKALSTKEKGSWQNAIATVTLSYADRILRRKRLTLDDGRDVLVDLPQTVSLNQGDVFVLDNGAYVEVRAAVESLLEITGDLPRLAWHIGNRHTPCQVEQDRLVIQDDKVLHDMLEHLGATLKSIQAPFTPEGGAYGHGRTMGHSN
ncbi:urease accessory protein UreE [Parasulfitobacter algicola]|uniref:Urease accessory protein UreE n=1 Tax=Parasulfitobacter algicola TaxID=2614809 RepID=A0ABX2IND9_9RHOB|nr:urease accessory protein UreE [Sulfitobacter algicola]NSX54402.1 urease accessory protein UreE [Sulfitobacter algicola]